MARPSGPAKVVFKYYDADGLIATLRDRRLLVRPIDGFNDPFEFLLAFDRQGSEDFLRRLLRKSTSLKRLAAQPELVGERLTVPQLRVLLQSDPVRSRVILTRLWRQSAVAPGELARELQVHFGKSVGLVCFSRVGNQPLMWSHYADQHRGFVLAYDLGRDHKSAKSVVYRAERVPFRHDDSDNHSLLEMIRTKARDWRYEHEVRPVLTELKWEASPRTGRVAFLDFGPEQVVGVWAGVRTKPEHISLVDKLLKSGGFRARSVGNAVLDDLRYDIRLEPSPTRD